MDQPVPSENASSDATDAGPAPQWQPLPSVERRVIGVLVEKAKTTPDVYPMTLNALRAGANQKSNRFPQMSLEVDQVDDALEQLRSLGAVVEVHGDGRVAKYRHQTYPWMGVEKVELAVMTELLLRGAQTVGELRGRAARMEPIADLAALRPILASLEQKNLIVYLTPEGRGCVVTHNLYRPTEMDKLRAEYGSRPATDGGNDCEVIAATSHSGESQSFDALPAAVDSDGLQGDLEQLTEQIRTQRDELASARSELGEQIDTLRAEVDEIKRQLGI